MTKSIGVGASLTVMTAGLIVFLVVFAQQFYLKLVMASIIAFQLSFIWTCAEWIDRPDDEDPAPEIPTDGDFTH